MKQLKHKICLVCHKEFDTYSSVAKYCSKTCRNQDNDNRRKPIKIICKNCGKTFYECKHKNKQFCSASCRSHYLNKNKICSTAIIENNNKRKIASMQHYIYEYEREYNKNNIKMDECSNNFAKIFEYLHNDYEYETVYYQLSDGTVYIPGLYRKKNNTYYIFNIVGNYTSSVYRYSIPLFVKDINDNKIQANYKLISHKVYNYICSKFRNKVNIIQNKIKIHSLPKWRTNKKHSHRTNIIKSINDIKIVSEEHTHTYMNDTSKQLLTMSLKIHSKDIDKYKFMRKNEEYNIALLMNKYNIDFVYDDIAFYFKTSLFIPQFYLPKYDKYIIISFSLNQFEMQKYKSFIKFCNDNKLDNRIINITEDKYTHLLPHANLPYRTDDIFKTVLNDAPIGICQICGKEFHIKDSQLHRKGRNISKFCSTECYGIARRTYTYITCKNCGERFKISSMDKEYISFCSDTCANEYKDKYMSGMTYAYDKKYQEGICEYCHKPFSYLGNKQHTFCSNSCKINYHIEHTKIKHVCKECNNIFYSHRKQQDFCSASCSSSYNARKIKFGSVIRPEKIWNDGLTAATSESVKNAISHALMTKDKQIQSGNISGNGCYCGYFADIGHIVRSGWEHNIAKLLQQKKIEYDYEPTKFTLSDGTIYIPDFFLLKTNTFIEVKGRWLGHAKEKFEKFKKENPNIKIKLIDKKLYHKLAKRYNFTNVHKTCKHKNNNPHFRI